MRPPPRPGPRDPEKNSAFTARPIGRRTFLIAAGGLATAAALRPHLAWARKAARLPQAPSVLQPWAISDDPPSSHLELARALIGAAVLAPSEWNTQPWRFEVEHASLRLVADPARLLPWTDRDSRGVMVSLGGALENLLIAARAYGLRPTVEYFPRERASGV